MGLLPQQRGEMPQAGQRRPFLQNTHLRWNVPMSHPVIPETYWNSASECREGAPSLGNVIFVTLHGLASGVAAAGPSQGWVSGVTTLV